MRKPKGIRRESPHPFCISSIPFLKASKPRVKEFVHSLFTCRHIFPRVHWAKERASDKAFCWSCEHCARQAWNIGSFS